MQKAQREFELQWRQWEHGVWIVQLRDRETGELFEAHSVRELWAILGVLDGVEGEAPVATRESGRGTPPTHEENP